MVGLAGLAPFAAVASVIDMLTNGHVMMMISML